MKKNNLEKNKLLKNAENQLLLYKNDIKKLIYCTIFGKEKFENKIDSLIFGYLIGYMSAKPENYLTEDKIKMCFNNFKKIKYEENDFNKLVNEGKDIIFNNFYDVNFNYNLNNKEKGLLEFLFEEENEEEKEKNVIKNEGDIFCEICFNVYNILDKGHYNLDCGCIVHNNCFEDYIKNCLEENLPLNQIVCPLCQKSIIKPSLILDLIKNSKKLKMYELIQFNNELRDIYFKSNNFIKDKNNNKLDYIICYNHKCNYSFKPDNINDFYDKFKCPKCGFLSCIKCQDYWHEGYTCEEFQKKFKIISTSIESFKKYAKKNNIFMCKNCCTYICQDEKEFPCRVIKCSVCNTKICTLCENIFGMYHKNYCRKYRKKKNI